MALRLLTILSPALLCCAGGTAGPPQLPLDPALCEANKSQLLNLVQQLPSSGRPLQLHTSLPAATLGSIVGEGQTVEISERQLWLNGRALPGTGQEPLAALRQHFEGLADTSERVYIATSQSLLLDRLRVVLESIPQPFAVQLLFEAPKATDLPKINSKNAPAAASPSLSQRLAEERDPELRGELISQAYAQFSQCPAVHTAVASVAEASPVNRWKQLRAALLEALPQCECASLDREHFGQLLVAEQRAGAGTLGSVPISFLRDERCGASIPRQSTQWLMKEIEAFDEEFAGQFRGEAMRFETVVTNDRLLRVMCPALPGETLAALQRKEHTLFWKLPTLDGTGDTQCQGWKFNALEKGSPMGNWRPISTGSTPSPLPIHFWQGAEEIRLYGPMLHDSSKATEDGPWSCTQEFRMVGLDAQSIELEHGRWFYSQEACLASTSDKDVLGGCIADLAIGKPLPTVASAAPTTTPAGVEESSNGTLAQ